MAAKQLTLFIPSVNSKTLKKKFKAAGQYLAAFFIIAFRMALHTC